MANSFNIPAGDFPKQTIMLTIPINPWFFTLMNSVVVVLAKRNTIFHDMWINGFTCLTVNHTGQIRNGLNMVCLKPSTMAADFGKLTPPAVPGLNSLCHWPGKRETNAQCIQAIFKPVYLNDIGFKVSYWQTN